VHYNSHLDYINYYAFSWQSDLTITPDGTRIAFMNREGIWVFSIQGDLFFHKSYNFPDIYVVTAPPPNIKINSEGNKIAVRYADLNNDQSMFEVIDIEEGRTELLEKATSGSSSLYYPIKFSEDSSILVTLDYSRNTGSKYRFWNTEDWSEISDDVAINRNIFNPGEMLTAEFEKGEMIVMNKFTDEIFNSIELFKWNDNWQQFVNQGYEPRRMSPIFSEDGTKVAYFEIYRDFWFEWNYFPYLAGMENYFLKIIVYDLVLDKKISEYDTYATSFNTIQLTNEGKIIDPMKDLFSPDEAWYEEGYLIDEVSFIDLDRVSFYPSHLVSIHNSDNFYQSMNPNCIFDFSNMNIDCEVSYINSDKERYKKNLYKNIYEVSVTYDYEKDRSTIIVRSLKDDAIILEKRVENNYYATTPVFINESVIAYTIHNAYDSNYFKVIFYDFINKEEISEFKIEKESKADPKTLSFCNNDKGILAIGFNDGIIEYIDTSMGTVIYKQKSHNTSIIGLLFSSDCRSLVSFDEVGFIKVWGIPPFYSTINDPALVTPTEIINNDSTLSKSHLLPTDTVYPENYKTPTLSPTKTPQPSVFCNINKEISDPLGDIEQTSLDLVEVVTNLENNDLNLYIYFATLSNATNFEVYIDIDGNSETGVTSPIYKKGAEYIVSVEYPIATQTYKLKKYNSDIFYVKPLQFNQEKDFIRLILDDIHITEDSLISIVSIGEDEDYLVCN